MAKDGQDEQESVHDDEQDGEPEAVDGELQEYRKQKQVEEVEEEHQPTFPLDDGDDVNSNIEMPAIMEKPTQSSDDTEAANAEPPTVEPDQIVASGEQETSAVVDPVMHDALQTSDSATKEEGVAGQEPEKKLDVGLVPAPHSIVEKNQQNGREHREDPHGVQEVLDELPLWREESQHLRANYSSTTAYRVAIKKRHYTTVGNTIFLICSGLLLIAIISAFLIYFARSVAGSKTNSPAGVAQVQPSNKAVVPVNLVGTETAAPRANGGVLAGYQWIHDDTKHELYIDPNKHIQELTSSDGQTWQITDLTRRSGAALANGRTLAGFEWQHGNSEQVVYIDAKQHVQQLYTSGNSQWDVLDLTRKAQAPLSNGTAITGYEWTQNGSKQVDYIDQRGHVQELASSDGINWTVSDLTKLTKAPQANGNVLTSYQSDKLGSKQVDYIDVNQHVQELSFMGGSWRSTDLNTLVGAPPASGRTIISYQWRQIGSRQIAYLDTSNHVQLLSSIHANNWSLVDLTHLISAPLANGNTLTGYEWQQGSHIVLYFIDDNDHLQEMSDAPSENWQLTDLNQFTQGTPSPNGKVLVGYDWAQHGSKQVAYIDNTNTVRELTSGNIPGKWELSSWKRS